MSKIEHMLAYHKHMTDPLICAKPTKTYPLGRTGMRAGYMAHYFAKEPACPPCLEGNRSRVAQDRSENPEQTLRGNLWARFRMTLEQYYSLLEKQGGRCAICLVDAPRDIRQDRFHVDHDHSCCAGRTACGNCNRGLLCHACNTALGNFGDDVSRLVRAAEYVIKYQAVRSGQVL